MTPWSVTRTVIAVTGWALAISADAARDRLRGGPLAPTRDQQTKARLYADLTDTDRATYTAAHEQRHPNCRCTTAPAATAKGWPADADFAAWERELEDGQPSSPGEVG
ncbi:hypothetical protein [Nocardioides bruguierae]|uniref:Uncharacterized protein n=1 Tax=Nocardioides bruguierae TaxID=2945102 RepID=A0A9X2DAZ0_9ACTN|nr:hypothetical protein [Nocardioides bruguierae]MCM0622601.1 hypothetical protein [Nocardioides bruguierae]